MAGPMLHVQRPQLGALQLRGGRYYVVDQVDAGVGTSVPAQMLADTSSYRVRDRLEIEDRHQGRDGGPLSAASRILRITSAFDSPPSAAIAATRRSRSSVM